MWQNPQFDYSLRRPTSTLAKQEWQVQYQEEKDEAIRKISERYGIFFLFESDCRACIKFANILDMFAKQYNLEVMGIAKDGKNLPNWQGEWLPDNKAFATRLQVEELGTPVLVLFDNHTKQPMLISVGLIAKDELARRMHYLTSVPVGSDF